MKVSATESVTRTVDKDWNTVLTVKLEKPLFFDTDRSRQTAIELLQQSLGKPVLPFRVQPIRDWTGRVIAYAIWKER
jgi:hypothetical protein